MAAFAEAGVRLAAKLGGKVSLKAAAEDFTKVFAKSAGKTAVRGDEMLAEGFADMGELEARVASSATKTSSMEAKMAAEGASESVARDAGSAAARDAEAAAAATEKAAVKSTSRLGRLGAKATATVEKNAGKLGLAGAATAAAGIASLVGTVMAGNEAAEVIDKAEAVAKETRDGLRDGLVDPILHGPLSALGWTEDQITSFETSATNVAMIGGVVLAIFAIREMI